MSCFKQSMNSKNSKNSKHVTTTAMTYWAQQMTWLSYPLPVRRSYVHWRDIFHKSLQTKRTWYVQFIIKICLTITRTGSVEKAIALVKFTAWPVLLYSENVLHLGLYFMPIVALSHYELQARFLSNICGKSAENLIKRILKKFWHVNCAVHLAFVAWKANKSLTHYICTEWSLVGIWITSLLHDW